MIDLTPSSGIYSFNYSYSSFVLPVIRFKDLAMACAVIGWSPVTIKTLIPAVSHNLIAGLTEFLGGSIKDKNPTSTKFLIGKLGTSSSYSNLNPFGNLLYSSSKCAKARTLSPLEARTSLI